MRTRRGSGTAGPSPGGVAARGLPWLALAVLALATTTIGAAAATHPSRPPSSPARPAAYDPPGANLELARLMAAGLLAEAWLPPAATAVPVPSRGPLSQPQSTFGDINLVDLASGYATSIPPSLLQEEAVHHPPPGASWSGGGTSSGPGAPDVYSLNFVPRSLPPFAQAAMLSYSYYRLGSRTLVRVDAEVLWRPYRDPATMLPPTVRLVVVRSVTMVNPGGVRRQSRTLGPGPALRSLVLAVDSEPTVAPGLIGCTMVQQQITVRFYTRSSPRPAAVATVAVGCTAFGLRVGPLSLELEATPTVQLLTRLLRD